MSTPASYTFRIFQGQTWQTVLRLKDALDAPIDLTGYLVRMQVREEVASPTPLLSLTTESGHLTVDGPAGEIAILVPADETSALPLADHEPANWVYDLEIISPVPAAPNGIVTRLMQGGFTVSPEVTR